MNRVTLCVTLAGLALLGAASIGCPSDPTFALSDDTRAATDSGATDSATIDETVSETVDTRRSTGADAGDTDTAGSTCVPECGPGAACFSGVCESCAGACAAVLAAGACGVDGCGGVCGCADTSQCTDGRCECPVGGCPSRVTDAQAYSHVELAIDGLRETPIVAARGVEGELRASVWNGTTWERDVWLAPWPLARVGAAAVWFDQLVVVHPGEAADATSHPVRATRWRRGSEAVTTEIAEPTTCATPRLVTRPLQGDILLGCIGLDAVELSFVRLVGGASWTRVYDPIVVGVWDNDAAAAVVQALSWTVDADGAPHVLAARALRSGPGPLVYATWVVDHWGEEEVATVEAPGDIAPIAAALALTDDGPQVFYVTRTPEGSVLRQAYRDAGSWVRHDVADLARTRVELAAHGVGAGLNLFRRIGATLDVDRLVGTTSAWHVAHTLPQGPIAISYATAPDGTPFFAVAAGAELVYQRADRVR